MQPTTPFNTQSWTVRSSELVGWLSLAAFFYWNRWIGLSTVTHIFLIISWAGYLFMRFCSLWHWHHQAKRGEGIEQQFTQVAVAAIYGFLVTNLAALSHILAFLIYPIAVVLASVSAINATLLYLWYKDPSRVPVNFYSHRKFINEDT